MEHVTTVVWHDPRLDLTAPKPGKIIDASLAFMDSASLGTKLYPAPSEQVMDCLHSCACLLETMAESAKERGDIAEWSLMATIAEEARALLAPPLIFDDGPTAA
jgi:hypothetical protein